MYKSKFCKSEKLIQPYAPYILFFRRMMWKMETKKVEPVVVATAVTDSFLSLLDIKNG